MRILIGENVDPYSKNLNFKLNTTKIFLLFDIYSIIVSLPFM